MKDNRGGGAKHYFLIDLLIVTLTTCPHTNMSSLLFAEAVLQIAALISPLFIAISILCDFYLFFHAFLMSLSFMVLLVMKMECSPVPECEQQETSISCCWYIYFCSLVSGAISSN